MISPTPTLSLEDFWALVATQGGASGDAEQAAYEDAIGQFLVKIASRADYVAVYRNEDFGSIGRGMLKIVSYGSDACQLEQRQFPDGPPKILPDIGGQINWRYQLVGFLAPGANP